MAAKENHLGSKLRQLGGWQSRRRRMARKCWQPLNAPGVAGGMKMKYLLAAAGENGGESAKAMAAYSRLPRKRSVVAKLIIRRRRKEKMSGGASSDRSVADYREIRSLEASYDEEEER